jgi:single-stranded DNA-specific DHH superfamily exonuclease
MVVVVLGQIADIITLTKQDYVTVRSGPLSLEARIGLLRRRRRAGILKQLVAVIGPLLLGMSILLLIAATGIVASAR